MKSLIIATDFSDAANNAAQYATHLSSYLSIDTVIIYHSYDNELYVNTDLPIQQTEELQKQREKTLNAIKALETKLAQISSKPVSFKAELNDQGLISGIKTLIAEYQAELVVVGSTGKSNFEQVLFGSNAMSLAKEITIPLLLVPKSATFKPLTSAVLACDLKRTEETLPLQSIRHFVTALGLNLHIINVKASDSEFIADTIPEQYKLHELLDDLSPSYDYIEHRDAATAILQFAHEHRIDLIISIKKNYGFFKDLFHKSITKKLAFNTHTPLLLLDAKVK
ncbi:universal stress protein [Olivibacter sp. XZL3]|uniref:universal stress protein n=1 Tax=Olivibacter sp. XZL3 TaxID=1735116 RepID=UPI00106532D5|nr:universal stress protein [Olivibacter sp. XZL3]